MESKKINQIFYTLDKWKNYPAYQLERRADIFFAIYLKNIINHKFQTDIISVIPEFPVHKGTIYKGGNNQSEKIDYAAVSENKVFFIELKTDMDSKRDHQDEYYQLAQKANIPNLINGLLKSYDATQKKYEYKYDSLFKEFIKIGWMNRGYQNLSKDYEIEVVYIQPFVKKEEKSVITITFQNVIDAIKDDNDHVTQRFIQSLKLWETEALEKEGKKRKRF